MKKLSFKEPGALNADLRSYQKEGYNWLKTMDFLGFGGILGDEMGLGKTIQAITFILSTLPSKTLIVAPTSLIYNWSNEIEKFAPSIKWAVLNGSKDERLNILNNISNYDVIITTYNILKREIIRSSHDGDGVRHLPLRDGDDGDVLPNLRAFLRAHGVRGGTCQSSGRFQGASQ